MGKETFTEAIKRRGVGIPAAREAAASTRVPESEMARLWNLGEGAVSLSQLREDGDVHVTLRQGNKDIHVCCHGFAVRQNSVLALLAHLLKLELIFPDTSIQNLLICQKHMWVRADIRSSFFNAGDSLLLIVSRVPPKPLQAPHKPTSPKALSAANLGRKKAIRKCVSAA